MRKDRYEKLRECIDKGKWDIDLENGVVIGKRGCRGNVDSSGYLQLEVRVDSHRYTFFVHEIIAVYGGLVPVDITIDHIDGDKTNNKFSNLQLLSHEENISKRHKGKGGYKGSEHPQSKLTENDVREIREMLKDETVDKKDIAKKYNVSCCTINDIVKRRTWTHI